jgi:protoporphyrinogen oxidase
MSSRPPVIVLGAGLAGLGCAHELGRRALVLEREPRVGGMARSVARQGFTFDCTGHWLHFAHPHTEGLARELLGDGLERIDRRAAISSQGITTPYPFQANTFGRPPRVVADCVLGYFRAREAVARGELPPPRNFEDYIRWHLGDGIARHFMLPYNTKLWTVPPAALDHTWCDRFVPAPTPEEVVRGALEPAGAGHGLGYNATFLYPRAGGIGVLAEALRASVAAEVRTGVAVTRIDWRGRVVASSAGESLAWQVLVSTAPLPDLVALLSDPPELVAAAARRLRAASVTYWDVGLPRPNRPGDAHWTYFPDPDVPFYRVGSPSAVLPALAPPGHRSLYVEVSHQRGTPVPATDAEVLRGLATAGLVGADEVAVLCERHTLDCAYVIMDSDYGDARRVVLDWLKSQRILSVGRYGAWTYDSMEGALVQGRRAAEQALELVS